MLGVDGSVERDAFAVFSDSSIGVTSLSLLSTLSSGASGSSLTADSFLAGDLDRERSSGPANSSSSPSKSASGTSGAGVLCGGGLGVATRGDWSSFLRQLAAPGMRDEGSGSPGGGPLGGGLGAAAVMSSSSFSGSESFIVRSNFSAPGTNLRTGRGVVGAAEPPPP